MKTIPLLILYLISFGAFAQITGKVTDEKQQPLPGATLQFVGSTMQTKLTDANGQFTFNGKADYLVISFTGYLTDTVKEVKQNMIVKLLPGAKFLKEVGIKSRQPVLRQEADRTVINVNEQIKKLADNAMEIIALAPGLTISDNEDAILMSGKAEVQVMINDKVVKMTARDLTKFLKAMPAGSVRSVELMSSPSAKYEVNGNTGIINIKTNQLPKGFNGNLDFSTSQSTYNWSDLSGIVNYGSGKLAISGYGGWHTGGYLTQDDKSRQLSDGNLLQQTSELEKWNDPIFRITVDYQLSERSTIGGIVEREASTNNINYTTHSQIMHNVLPDSAYLTTGIIPYIQRWNTYNLNYRYNDTTGNQLTADLDLATYERDNHTTVLTTQQSPVVYHTITNTNIATFKTDYTHNWKNKTRLEAGLKISGVQTSDNENGNTFVYHENVRALYAGLSKNYERWGFQLGVRAEQTSANGVTGGGSVKPDTNYLNLLPSAYITYAPDSKNSFRLSFSRRVKRPDYDNLLPITYELDPLDYKTGNPGLRVQRNDNAELSYTFDDRITLVGSYTHSGDYFSQVIQQVGNLLYQTTSNAGTRNTVNFDLNYPVQIKRWWNMINKLNVADDHFQGQQYQAYLDESKWHYQLSTTQRFNLPGKYLLQLGARYTSAAQNLIYYQQSSGNTTVSISKKFFNEQLSVKAGISDLFKTQRNNTSVNSGGLIYTDLGRFESRRVSFSLNWRFGNDKIRKTEERERGDADEKSRSGS